MIPKLLDGRITLGIPLAHAQTSSNGVHCHTVDHGGMEHQPNQAHGRSVCAVSLYDRSVESLEDWP